MRSSRLAGQIIADMKREEFFKKKAIKKDCIINKDKRCNECNYQDICKEKITST